MPGPWHLSPYRYSASFQTAADRERFNVWEHARRVWVDGALRWERVDMVTTDADWLESLDPASLVHYGVAN